jgi:aspartyl/asparaginyl-tRNA synthetase
MLTVLGSCILGCTGLFTTKIKDILQHPRDFDGRTVTIAGEVKESANILFIKYFIVQDDTGEITVVTNRAVPRQGDKVRVTGRVNQAFAIGDKSVVAIVEESPKS